MPRQAKQKIIITAALTGGGHGKEANPNLPEQPDEIIEDTLKCREAGASIVHIHARDKRGKSTMNLRVLRAIQNGIKASSDLIVQLSTGSPTLPMEERIAPLKLKPEMASLNTFLIALPGKDGMVPAIYTRPEIEYTARRCQELGVKPVVAIINFCCLEEMENLIAKGLLDKPYFATIGLNMPAQGALRGTPQNLMALRERLPQGTIFEVSAHGEAQLPLTTMGMVLGGHVRVGLEDSVHYVPGRLAKSNAEMVARAVRIAKDLSLEVATPDEARETLQLHHARK
ncbi:MAG: 3-keto-5-aminohexanoate cleavage protein [Chloroflexota bacterium]